MNRQAAREFLRELTEAGVEIRSLGTDILCRPVGAMTDSQRRMARHLRDDILVELEARRDPLTCAVIETFEGLITLESEWPTETARFREPGFGFTSCHSCRGRSWWRLRSGGTPVCERCHPSPYPDTAVERWKLGT